MSGLSRYVLRRVAQMAPTLLGVLLVTFVLFNVVGGSPAAMVLGQHAAPRALEEFDEQRGFNKPLLCGRWVRTRALDDARARVPPLEAGASYRLPLAFPLRAGTVHRLQFEACGAPGARLRLTVAGAAAGAGAGAAVTPGGAWRRHELCFATGAAPARDELALCADGGSVELRAVRLRRAVARPWDSQFLDFFKRVAVLDLGISHSLNQPVRDLLRRGVGPSLALAVPILIGETLLALTLALGCAAWRDRWPDRLLVVGAVAVMSVNYLVWIVAGQYVLAFRLGWFPIWGYESWRCLALPILIGIISGLGSNVRFYRAVLLEETTRDYVRTARAKGAGEGRVLFRHILRNALLPVVTHVAGSVPFLFTGSLLLESFFGIPGLGYLGVNALNSADVDVIRALVLIGALLYLFVNLATDLLYAWLDPRIRLA